jgi:hypothetical protein
MNIFEEISCVNTSLDSTLTHIYTSSNVYAKTMRFCPVGFEESRGLATLMCLNTKQWESTEFICKGMKIFYISWYIVYLRVILKVKKKKFQN